MTATARAAFEAAYRATTYRVHLAEGDVDIRVGRRHPQLDRWLAGRGADCWAWITAVNPGSVRLSTDENGRRQDDLRRRVQATGHAVIAAESLADAGDWPPEAGVLVAAIGRQEALALADLFGQNAILAGECGKRARLVWTSSGDGI